jgi:hypothetical protein
MEEGGYFFGRKDGLDRTFNPISSPDLLDILYLSFGINSQQHFSRGRMEKGTVFV